MLCSIKRFWDECKTVSVIVTGCELSVAVSSTMLVSRQQNIFGHISLFWSVVLQGRFVQQSGGDCGWLIQIPVSTVLQGTSVQPDVQNAFYTPLSKIEKLSIIAEFSQLTLTLKSEHLSHRWFSHRLIMLGNWPTTGHVLSALLGGNRASYYTIAIALYPGLYCWLYCYTAIL